MKLRGLLAAMSLGAVAATSEPSPPPPPELPPPVVQAIAEPKIDPIAAVPQESDEIEAIRAELARGMAGLRLEGTPEPYRAEVRLVRAELLSLDGSYGGIITNVLERQATGIVEVRVGNVTLDNSNYFGAQSGISGVELSLDAAPQFLRKELWLALDRAFRGASQSYAAKTVAIDRLHGVEPADFTPPPPPQERPVPPPAGRSIDREGLTAMTASLSARFGDWPAIDNGDVLVQLLRSHETVINTEGLMLQWANDRAVVAIVADTKAPDGMRLDHGLALHIDGTPAADDALLREGEALVDRVLRELSELALAPMIEEEYDGPILFSGLAAAQLLASMVAPETSGMPPPLSESGRFMELEPAWQKELGKLVMPPFIDLVDDPTADGFGHFTLDAQGFTPARLVLVDGGRLVDLLMTRTPNVARVGSNGRARMSPSLESGPTISNLTLSSRRRGLPTPALIREVLARAHEDGYDFAYFVESLRDGAVLGGVERETAMAHAGTGKIDLPLPARVFRVGPSGDLTLVRGAILAPASMRVLRRIRSVGLSPTRVPMRIPVGSFGGFNTDVGIDGVLSQTVDVEVTAPELLIDGLELLVERGEHEKLPTLVHPLRRPRERSETSEATH